jgi:hypothetical protein
VIVNWVAFYMVHLVIHKSVDDVAVDERDPIVCSGKWPSIVIN